ncbi:cupin domain-containing protein [Desulfosporosinus sp. PR]|uniref:cupin domain-containing protein n=1 Tax=Candidatus Desulfosporosinus nitrosoreducens TaxID=3401928 RepID=UPI0027F29261|nr:cupin domain-containing protein [Desulfosporosinus sp. PR]MDQ7095090.1 cupin domain-containing protein [Desulfosporosinus sp. PR]
MKKLICANEVKAAVEKGEKTFFVDCGTIITPAAQDLAKESGLEFTTASPAAGPKQSCEESGLRQEESLAAGLDRDVIYQVVKALFSSKLLANVPGGVPEAPFLTEGDPGSGLKIVRGRTVNFETFATGNPGDHVACREVVSKKDSQMSAGFLTIEKSSFVWELCYEEIDIVLEGSLTVTINNKTYEACQGDVLFVPKGSKVTWSSSGYVKLFYVTYPANWSELKAQE